MVNIRKINPVARAVGTVGVVAGLVGAVTFANLTSNTVALTDNELASATAQLQIGSDAEPFTITSVAGINTDLVPGVPKSFTYYLKNTGDVSMSVKATVPTDVSASTLDPSKVTLSFDCGGGPVSFTMNAWSNGGTATVPGTIAPNQIWTCSETATLDSGYTGQGGQSMVPFTVNFDGTQI